MENNLFYARLAKECESVQPDPVSLIKSIIEHGMEKKDRSVTVYFGESGISISVYPLTDEED